MKKHSRLSALMEHAGKHRYLTYISWFLAAVSSILALVPFVYIWLIIRDVLNYAPNFDQAKNITYYGWMAVLFAVISMIIYMGGLLCSHLSAFRIATNLRIKCIQYLVTLSIGDVERLGSGKLRKIILDSSEATETYLAHRLPDKAAAIATPIGLLFLLFMFDWRLGVLSLIPVVLAFIIMTKMTGQKMEQKMNEYKNSLEDMSNEAVEYVRGIPVVKTFGQTVYSFKRFKASIDNYEKWVIAYTKDLRLPMMFYTTAINAVFAFLIAGAIAFSRSAMTNELLLNLLFYVIVTPIISTTLTRIMFMSEDSMIVDDAMKRIDNIFDMKPLATKSVYKTPKDNSVTLENVSYSYDGKKYAVRNISLKVKPNSTVAFVGGSGSGKTTLANIISRFFDPQTGKVLIGGINIKDIKKEELMDTISFVFQNSKLIKASVLDNVKMAKPDATRCDVINALNAAQCADIIEKLPNGINTVIGTNGIYLSGGEQQRVAIARAMLKNAPVLILDEATAFADPDNEILVQKAFSEMAKNKTVIMVAHRLSTVKNADCIYVLKDGQIEESGTHKELLQQKGLYSKMWSNYQKSIDWKVGAYND